MSDTAYTISVHGGPQVSQGHNRREPEAIKRQDHIDPDGHYEVWADRALEDLYNEIFGSAVEEYNKHQRRADRRISDYLKSVKGDSRRHGNLAYEVIVAVGNYGSRPDPEVCRQILLDYYMDWQNRNPQLAVLGAYFHADERGTPHLHLDYVPWADGYKRGPARQVGLDRALQQQGHASKNRAQTAQMAWQDSERQALRDICREHGIDTYMVGDTRAHMETDLFRLTCRLEELQAEIALLSEADAQRLLTRHQGLLSKLLGAHILSEQEYTRLVSGTIYTDQQAAAAAESREILRRRKQILQDARARADQIIREAEDSGRITDLEAHMQELRARQQLEEYRRMERRHPGLFAEMRSEDRRERGLTPQRNKSR